MFVLTRFDCRSENTNNISKAFAKDRSCETAYPISLEGRCSVLEKLLLCPNRLPPGGMDRMKTKFLDLNLNARAEGSASNSDEDVNLSCKCSEAGGHKLKLGPSTMLCLNF